MNGNNDISVSLANFPSHARNTAFVFELLATQAKGKTLPLRPKPFFHPQTRRDDERGTRRILIAKNGKVSEPRGQNPPPKDTPRKPEALLGALGALGACRNPGQDALNRGFLPASKPQSFDVSSVDLLNSNGNYRVQLGIVKMPHSDCPG